MANLNVSWVLPTVKENGRPLPVAEISHVRIELSADEGQTFGLIGDFPPDVLETVIADLDFGTWVVKGIVADVRGRTSVPTIEAVVNEDTSPPGSLSLTLALA